MKPVLDPATRAVLQERMRFYRDLGLTEFYRRPVDPALLAQLQAAVIPEPVVAEPTTATAISEPSPSAQGSQPAQNLAQKIAPDQNSLEDTQIPPRKIFPAAPAIGAVIAPAKRAAALQAIRDEIGDCTRCSLHKGRNQLVFADGDPNARLLFVGEGPGADEDAQGLPFVGRAGQLLNNMINAMGLQREQVYIANVVKCRPPQNRTPEPEEAHTCTPFLFRQIDVVRPEVIVALGATAATYLLGQRQPLAGLRGRVHSFRQTKLIVTYHPAYLLRDPRQKKEAWADLQIAMRELGLKGKA
ncbi:uracil-DNA glycosylase [Telmatobacter bradus]|uniref:uracil-DNA glycosylase n=1 Tax=Telmatobacter bradus TaxID=474953 RepID=UPI003B42D9E8